MSNKNSYKEKISENWKSENITMTTCKKVNAIKTDVVIYCKGR